MRRCLAEVAGHFSVLVTLLTIVGNEMVQHLLVPFHLFGSYVGDLVGFLIGLIWGEEFNT